MLKSGGNKGGSHTQGDGRSVNSGAAGPSNMVSVLRASGHAVDGLGGAFMAYGNCDTGTTGDKSESKNDRKALCGLVRQNRWDPR